MKTLIEVDINNIQVDDRYYSFKYEVKENGRTIAGGVYDSDHSWSDNKEDFLKILERGEAVKLALEEAY